MWEGGRSPQTKCVPTGGVAGWSVTTHQRWLCLLDLHCTLVKLCCFLKVSLFVTILQNEKRKQRKITDYYMYKYK